MVERPDDLMSFIAYMLLPAELFLAMILYPRFFLALPPVAIAFGIFLFGFSFCCGGVHYLRATQRIDTLQMDVLSWGTAFSAIGTALFLLPNISIFFKEVDKSLREQSNDNAILVEAKRKEETFRSYVSYQLRNPLHAMEARMKAWQERLEEENDDHHDNNNYDRIRTSPSTNAQEVAFRDTLQEINAMRVSILTFINASLDPDTCIPNTTRTDDPASKHTLDVRRLLKQSKCAVNFQREEEARKRQLSPFGVASKSDEEDPPVDKQFTLPEIIWHGHFDEVSFSPGRLRVSGNACHTAQIMYNLFFYLIASHTPEDEQNIVVKYHVSLVDYDKAWHKYAPLRKHTQNDYRKTTNRSVLVMRLDCLDWNQIRNPRLRPWTFRDGKRTSPSFVDGARNTSFDPVASLSLDVAIYLAEQADGSVHVELPDEMNDSTSAAGSAAVVACIPVTTEAL